MFFFLSVVFLSSQIRFIGFNFSFLERFSEIFYCLQVPVLPIVLNRVLCQRSSWQFSPSPPNFSHDVVLHPRPLVPSIFSSNSPHNLLFPIICPRQFSLRDLLHEYFFLFSSSIQYLTIARILQFHCEKLPSVSMAEIRLEVISV